MIASLAIIASNSDFWIAVFAYALTTGVVAGAAYLSGIKRGAYNERERFRRYQETKQRAERTR